MKLLLTYAASQIIALAILFLHDPLMFIAIPLVLIGNYALMIVFYNIISGRRFKL